MTTRVSLIVSHESVFIYSEARDRLVHRLRVVSGSDKDVAEFV
jgi:hypothetical protein